MARSRAVAVGRLLGPLLVIFALYAALAYVVGRQMPANASVLGVHVGGMTAEAARERLDGKLRALEEAPIELVLDDVRRRLRPVDVGLSVDEAGTLQGTTGFSLDPRVLWERVEGGGPLPVRTAMNADVGVPAVQGLAAGVDREVTQAAVTFRGAQVEAVRPVYGRRVEVEQTLARLQDTWPAATSVTAEITRTDPQVSPQQLDLVVEQVAERAVSGPVTLVHGRTRVPVPVARFAPTLKMRPQGDTLVLGVDPAAFAQVVREAAPAVEREPRDAGLRMSGGRPVVVPAVAGSAVDADRTAAGVQAALLRPDRAAPVALLTRPAARSTAAMQAWKVSEVIGRGGARADVPPGDPAAVANATRAAAALNGALVAPRAEFSLARSIGEPDAAAGYATATVLEGGQPQQVVGGGASALAAAAFEAAYTSGLPVGARTSPPVHVPGAAKAYAATVGAGADVTFTNDTDTGVFIEAGVNGGRVVVRLWGAPTRTTQAVTGERRGVTPATPRDDLAAGCVPQPVAEPGFEVDATRTVRVGGQERTETLTTRFAPLDPVRCGAAPATP